ncbi:hypothetical protein ES702_05618 [subsurface metagenome]
MKGEVIEKLAALITAAFGLFVALCMELCNKGNFCMYLWRSSNTMTFNNLCCFSYDNCSPCNNMDRQNC